MATAVLVLKHENSTTYQSHIYESIDLKFGQSDNVTRFSNPAKFGEDRFSVVAPRGGEIYGSRTFFIIIIFVFIFLDTHTAYTREPILTHSSSKDAVELKKCPFSKFFLDIFTFWGSFSPQNPNISLPVRKPHAKRKCQITSNPFELGQKLSLTTNRKSWPLFQNPSWKIDWSAPGG